MSGGGQQEQRRRPHTFWNSAIPFQLTKVLSSKSALPATKSGNWEASASTTMPEDLRVGWAAVGSWSLEGRSDCHPSGRSPVRRRENSAYSLGNAFA